MASIFDGIDMADPCAVYPVLEAAYYRLLAGENVVRSKFGDEEMQFSIADAKVLEKKIADLKAQCRAKNSGRTARRHVIRCGWR